MELTANSYQPPSEMSLITHLELCKMDYQPTERLGYQLNIRKKVHSQMKEDTRSKPQEEINIAAELEYLRNTSVTNRSRTKLRGTHFRRAMNAANRINSLSGGGEPGEDRRMNKVSSVKSMKAKALLLGGGAVKNQTSALSRRLLRELKYDRSSSSTINCDDIVAQ